MLAFVAFLLLFTASAHAEIRVVDVSTGAVTTLDGPQLRGWTDDGAALLVGDGLRLELTGGFPTPQPQLAGALSIGPGGRAVDLEDGTYRLHAPDGRVLATVPAGFLFDQAKVTWSASRVAIVVQPALHTSAPVTVLDTATGAVVLRRDSVDADVSQQAFAPDGSALLLSERARVLRVEIPSGRATVLYRSRRSFEFPSAAWGASGRIAITHDDGIGVMGLPGVHAETDTTQPALWSADGRLLRFVVLDAPDACSDPFAGVSVAAPGETPRALVPPSGRALGAALWSPVGSRLAIELGDPPPAEVRGPRKAWPRRVARDYEMFSARGDLALRRIVLRASRSLRRGAGREEVLSRVRRDYARADERFDEAGDTAVREAVADELDRWLVAAGFEPIEAFDEITC